MINLFEPTNTEAENLPVLMIVRLIRRTGEWVWAATCDYDFDMVRAAAKAHARGYQSHVVVVDNHGVRFEFKPRGKGGVVETWR